MIKSSSLASWGALHLAFLFLVAAPVAHAQLTVDLTTSLPSVQPVGTQVRLDTSVENANGKTPLYQFAIRPVGGQWAVRRDYSIWPRFGWSTLDQGFYELRVRAVLLTGELAEDILPFLITSRVTNAPSVIATSHPLIALYSAPACVGGQLWVRFRPVGSLFWQNIPAKPCLFRSLNFHVAGMRANTNYEIQQVRFVNGGFQAGPLLNFQTGVSAVPFSLFTMVDPPDAQTSWLDDVLLMTHVIQSPDRNFPVATDLAGNVIWYYDELAGESQAGSIITRPLPGGTMLVILNGAFEGQYLREIDIAGNIIRETNARWISKQLLDMGHDAIGAIHHDAIRLPNGHTVVIGSVERILVDVQGPGPVNVYGEMLIDLDESFQVVWAWNAFEKMDAGRMAILGEVCESEGPGCPPLFLDETANDWLHANSVDYVPEDGSLLMSLRHQDWVIKIDYQNGAGSGDVLWRLGEEGDFQIVSQDLWPWFSHQHDAEMENGLLVLYDNGNVRVEGPQGIGGNSRGQALLLDEQAGTATLVHNSDLGGYSFALGSAQRLTNGNYHFNSGFLGERSSPFAHSIEATPSGQLVFIFQAGGAVYRSFRMMSLYTP